MRQALISVCLVLALVRLDVATSWAQQHGEFTPVTIRMAEDGTWLMDITESDGTQATWSLQLGAGCENIQPGPAGLLVDGVGAQWLVLPDATPGTCPIEGGDVLDQG